MKQNPYIFSIIQALIFVLSIATNWYGSITLFLLGNLVFQIIHKLGKGIILRETVALHMCFICLAMPLAGYTYFGRTTALGIMWGKYMRVPEETYFSFALPAVAGFIFFLCFPLTGIVSDQGSILNNTLQYGKRILNRNPKVGLYILFIGTIMLGVSQFLPTAIQFAFLLFYFSAFAGFLYIYFSKVKYRVAILAIFAIFILLNALNSGMFTVVAYMGLTLFSFFFLGQKISFLKKLFWVILSAFVLVVIQKVKQQYRDYTWHQKFTGNKVALFSRLVSENIYDLNISLDAIFPLHVRANQGFNVSLVMKRFPQKQQFDNGNKLFVSFAAAFVPRFIWPDKPEAGGVMNMKYYAGVAIKGWSTNVGPLGEAYGSFGVTGGIIFMCLLGGIIRWAYRCVFLISRTNPLIIFWIPVLFYQITYSSETDTLQIVNSLVKSAFFIWVLYKIVPLWFGKEKSSHKKFSFTRSNEGSFIPAKI